MILILFDWKRFLIFLLVLVGVAACGEVFAETLVSTGRSVVKGDLEVARSEALNDAVRNAMLQQGGYVEAATNVQNGNVVDDQVRLAVHGKVRNIEVIDESHNNGIFKVKIKAEVVRQRGCGSSRAGSLSKSVLFTAFPRLKPETSRVGRLYNIDSDFADALSRRLYPVFGVSAQVNDELTVISDTRYSNSNQLISDQVQNIAEEFQSQFIVSGSIDDMSMVYPERYFERSGWDNIVLTTNRLVGGWFSRPSDDIRIRNFSFRVVLFDGVSGQIIYDRRYQTGGIWDAGYTEIIKFGTPRFWATDYGQAVSGLVDKVVLELGHKIRCQPFMVNATVVEGQRTVHVDAGMNHGVKIGDVFGVYSKRRVRHPYSSRSASAGYVSLNTRRLEAESELKIIQTYPTYSLAKATMQLHADFEYLAILF